MNEEKKLASIPRLSDQLKLNTMIMKIDFFLFCIPKCPPPVLILSLFVVFAAAAAAAI